MRIRTKSDPTTYGNLNTYVILKPLSLAHITHYFSHINLKQTTVMSVPFPPPKLYHNTSPCSKRNLTPLSKQCQSNKIHLLVSAFFVSFCRPLQKLFTFMNFLVRLLKKRKHLTHYLERKKAFITLLWCNECIHYITLKQRKHSLHYFDAMKALITLLWSK